MDHGSEEECGPGDVGYVPPGHNAWIIGTPWQDLKVESILTQVGMLIRIIRSLSLSSRYEIQALIVHHHQFRALY